MTDFTLFNHAVEKVGEALRFSSKETKEHSLLLAIYETLNDYDFIRALNFQKRLQKGLRFKSLEHFLDTAKNIPYWY